MGIPTVKELVQNNQKAHFFCYKDNELWYKIGDFKFPIPIDDVGSTQLLAEEKALLLMRWIRKYLTLLTSF